MSIALLRASTDSTSRPTQPSSRPAMAGCSACTSSSVLPTKALRSRSAARWISGPSGMHRPTSRRLKSGVCPPRWCGANGHGPLPQNRRVMARRRWTEASKRITREAVTWIHLLLQERGPMSTREIIDALEAEGRPVRVHELQRALRRAEHVHPVDERDAAST